MSQDSSHDPAFDVVPIGSTFFFIWRVKEFELVPVPKEEYGKFYKGDCYIVFCCSEFDSGHSQMESKPLKNTIGFTRIHFWIGSESSQDESGVAAIKTVELDDYLGGYPIQHREVEGYESKQFLSYFRSGIRLLKGGFQSGFHKVDNQLHPALFHVKGKKRPIVQEMNEISWSVINSGDVFILLSPKYIFIWTGQNSNRMERFAAIKIANELKDNEYSRFHLSVVVVNDGEETSQLSGDEYELFNQLLPLGEKEAKMQKFSEEFNWLASDTEFESNERQVVQLYRCTESRDQIDIKFIKDGPLTRSDLDSNDTFIVSNGSDEIWVWVGKHATKKERSSAMKYAMEMIKTKNFSPKTEVTKVIEDGENVEFKSLFKSWIVDTSKETNIVRLFRLLRNGSFAQVVQFEQHDLEEDNIMILDTVGKIYLWAGKNFLEQITDESKLNKIAQRYVLKDKSGRQFAPNEIVIVKQGDEDERFKSYFNRWN